jgi:hypothetical protein
MNFEDSNMEFSGIFRRMKHAVDPMSSVPQIREVKTGRDLAIYIKLPAILNRNYPAFVPPLWRDEFHFHNPLKNRNLESCEVIRFLAFLNGEVVGRIMGIIHHNWNETHGNPTARFYQPEFIDDYKVCSSLVQAVTKWAHGKGMNLLIGSFGLSDKDPQGIQIEGFHLDPVIASVSHQPYIARHFEVMGFEKFKDCVSYVIPIPDQIPDVYRAIYNRIVSKHGFKLLEFKSRKELKPFFKPVMELMNDAYSHIYGFVPLTETDIQELADQYLNVLDPRLVKVAVDQNNIPVSFVIAMGNISAGFRKAKGKLFPTGWFHLLQAMKNSRQLDLLLGAVHSRHRGKGLNVMMGVALMESARQLGMKTLDSHLILEENLLMRAELEKLGGKIMKRYRIFQKEIDVIKL